MIDIAVRALDVVALVVLGALFAGVARLALRTFVEARWLDDPWLDTPGGRNDRRALLEEDR